MATVLLDLTPLNSDSRTRGIGRYVSSLARAIAATDPSARRGLEVTGLVRDVPWGGGPWFDPTLGFAGNDATPPQRVARRWHHFVRRLTLYGRLRRTRAALFHATEATEWAPPAGLAYVVTCFDLIPILFAGLYPSSVPFTPQLRLRDARRWYGRARRVIAVSEATRRDLVATLGLDPARIDVVPCGVDSARFHAAPDPADDERVREALGTSRPYLLYVGGADARKNVPFLLRAFARSGVAADVDLVLVGSDPALAAAVRTTAAACGVAGRVLLPGYVSDATVAALYRRCRGHVFASLYEGFGLTVAEALASGAPTATTMNSSVPEVAGDAAIELPATDVDGAAAVIRRLVDDAALRDDLRRRGPLQVRNFTWEACARGVLETYRRALADER